MLKLIPLIKPKKSFHKDFFDCFIFTHIPKCGGTSFRKFLYKSSLFSGIKPNYTYIPGTNGLSNEKNINQLSKIELKHFKEQQFNIIGCHSTYGIHENYAFGNHPFYFTILRNPIERFISHYYYFYYNDRNSIYHQSHLTDLDSNSLTKVIHQLSNIQVKSVLNLEHSNISTEQDLLQYAKYSIVNNYHCFGLLEDMGNTLNSLFAKKPSWLKLYYQYPFKNQLNTKTTKSIQLNDAILNKIRLHNSIDIEFYEFSKKAFYNQQLMNKKIFYTGLFCALMGLISCSNDKKVINKNSSPKKTTNIKRSPWTTIPGNSYQDIKAYNKGVYTIKNGSSNKGMIYQWDNKNWKKIPGQDTKSITSTSNGNLYAIRDMKQFKDVIFKWDGKNWKNLPGQGNKTMTVDSNGNLYAIRDMKQFKDVIFQWDGKNWKNLPGQGNKTMTVDSNGNLYAIRDMKKFKDVIFKWDGKNWKNLPGQGNKTMTVDSNGNLYAIRDMKQFKDVIFQWDGKNWKNLPGQGNKTMTVDSNGNLYAIRDMKEFKDVIFKWDGKNWKNLPGQGNKNIASSNSHIFSLKKDRTIISHKLN